MSNDSAANEPPVIRDASRVLLIDARDRVLLFRTYAATRGHPLWITPGGGLHPGETHEQAALREMWEETGVVADLGPCVWVRQHIFRLGERLLDERERIYVVRVDEAAVTNDNWEPEEHTFLTAHRWWSLAEIVASDDWFAPRRITEFLPAIITGQYPAEPFDIGP
ncbi:MAG: NUDIX domain-containing protein [Casimicrobiaceae bacterium]